MLGPDWAAGGHAANCSRRGGACLERSKRSTQTDGVPSWGSPAGDVTARAMSRGNEALLAGLEMLLTNPVPTCLSPTVHYMVCKLGFERNANYAISTIVSDSGEIYWKTITKHMQYKEPDHSVDYIKSVQFLGPICESVHLHLQSFTMEQFQDQFVMWFSWTSCSEIFVEMFDALKSSHSTVISLCLMKLTSCLERALGDVFLLIGKDCPFLLRDLLASQELATIFGQSVMDVLKVFTGSPNGLNLRNILWHGFASPQEIPVKYSSMLLFLTVGLGQLLKHYLLQTQSTLIQRSCVSFTNLQELHVFPDLTHEQISVAENIVINSSIVLRTMLPFWITALTSFKQNRYADCIILLLPQLESGLRLLFTIVNKCPSRLMTAESSSLYTTFDEMLAKELSNEEVNQLPLVLGESKMAFLWDFLNHQEGPRIRDHLSHGEIRLKDFPREIANSVLAFSITLLCRFSKDDIATVKEHTVLEPLMNCANGYCSRFHPIAKLRKQIMKCMKSLTLWSDLPKLPDEQLQEVARSDKDTVSWICVTDEILALLQPYLSQNVTDNPMNSVLTEKLLIELCSKHVCILFCPRSVLETVVVLRQITTQCYQVLSQVISSCETRYTQWMNKSLRSRQRNNYLRMRRSIKLLSPVLQLILILIALELVHIHTACEKNPPEYQQYLKFLKMILQYMENLATYTSAEKNKWAETMELTQKALISIRTFLEKQLMLIQLAR